MISYVYFFYAFSAPAVMFFSHHFPEILVAVISLNCLWMSFCRWSCFHCLFSHVVAFDVPANSSIERYSRYRVADVYIPIKRFLDYFEGSWDSQNDYKIFFSPLHPSVNPSNKQPNNLCLNYSQLKSCALTLKAVVPNLGSWDDDCGTKHISMIENLSLFFLNIYLIFAHF